jgi:hypothetical protein
MQHDAGPDYVRSAAYGLCQSMHTSAPYWPSVADLRHLVVVAEGHCRGLQEAISRAKMALSEYERAGGKAS